MKTTFLILFTLTLSISLIAKEKIVENPSYEVKNTGIYNVSKIEMTDTSTRVYIHNTFIHGWWVLFEKEDIFLRDVESLKHYPVSGIEGTLFGEKLRMPKSGDSTIVLIFPPLDAETKKIDYISTSEKSSGEFILGISLEESSQDNIESAKTLPENVKLWFESELAKVDEVPLKNFSEANFFKEASTRLIGYIKGYDPRLGFTTGIIYSKNTITREDYPVVVNIQADGRFEAQWVIESPQYSRLSIQRQWIPFYVEPGQTLAMVLDWDEFLIGDRRRNIRYQIQDIEYYGPLANTNKELDGFSIQEINFKKLMKKVSTMTPQAFKEEHMLDWKIQDQRADTYIKENQISDKAASIINNELDLSFATRLFDFVERQKYEARSDTNNTVLKIQASEDYYDFLKDMGLNDVSITISDKFSPFVNRFEYCEPLSEARRKSYKRIRSKPKKTLDEYFEEEGIEVAEEFSAIFNAEANEQVKLANENKELLKKFSEAYKDEIKAYVNKNYYASSSGLSSKNREWQLKDSVYQNQLGLEPSLVYEIAKTRSLKFTFEHQTKEESENHWSFLQKGITHPYLIETGNRMFKQAFPEEESLAYSLSEGYGTEVFKKIIDPFKGKVLFVDFWATTCGPCIAGIKKMKDTREKYKNSEDFAFIFITDERGSPEKTYNSFVTDQDLVNTYRLSKDDYNHLRQLFKFNGIPRYVVIDENGKVLDDDFPMHNFNHKLEEILAKNGSAEK